MVKLVAHVLFLIPTVCLSQSQIDSLSGFSEKHEIEHMMAHGVDSSKIDYYLDLAKERYINKKYNLGVYTPPMIPKSTSSSIDCANDNWGFEDGTLNGWIQQGAVQVVSGGIDPYGNYSWVYPNGGNFSAKVSSDLESQKNGRLDKVINVPSSGETIMSFHFAMSIFNYPHTADQAAKLWVEFYDENGNLLSCPYYECYYSTDNGAVGVDNFEETDTVASFYNPTANGDSPNLYTVTYADWNTVTLDLSSYQGQQITVVFRVEWCIYGPDWAYVLLDVDCPLHTSDPIDICLNETSQDSLCGPDNMSEYTWYGPSDTIIGNSQCIEIDTAGTFVVDVVPDEIECNVETLLSFEYNVVPPLNISYSASNYNGFNTSCHNSDDGWILLDSSLSNYSINWSNGENSTYLDSLTQGVYNVEIVDSVGCNYNLSIDIQSPTQLLTNLQHSDYNSYGVSCYGSSDGYVLSTTSGGVEPYSYSWTNSIENTQDIFDVSSGNYSLLVTDLNGCQVNESEFLSQPLPLIDQTIISNYNGYNISCIDSSDGFIDVTISGGVAPFNYTWSNNVTTPLNDSISSGVYFLEVIDDNNCAYFESYNITSPTQITSTILSTSDYNGYDISCYNFNDGSVELFVSGSVPPYSYSWTNGGNQNNLNNLFSGFHAVEIIDANGCTHSDNIILSQPDSIASSIVSVNNYNGYDVSCFNLNNGEIDLSVSGGVAPYLYSWNNGAGVEDINNLDANDYSVNVVDQNGCSVDLQITLTAPPPLVLNYQTSNFNGYNISCHSLSDGWIDVDIEGSVPPYTYSWSNAANSQDLSNVSQGQYSVVVQDLNQCEIDVDITLNQPPPLETQLSAITNYNGYNISCFGFNDGGVLATISGSVPPYNIAWNTGELSNPLINLFAGTYVLSVVDENNCQISDSILLNQPSQLVSNIASAFDYNGYDISCYNYSDGGIDLSVFGGVSPYYILWSTDETLEDLFNLSAGNYGVFVSDNNDCQITNNITLNEPTPLTLDFDVSNYNGYNVSCYGLSDGFINSFVNGSVPPYTFDWNNGASSQNITQLESGTFSLTVVDQNNCIISDAVQMTEPNDFFITLNHSSDTCSRGVANATVSVTPEFNPYSYLWSNGEVSSSINNLYAGTNSVSVSDVYDCSKLIEFEVENLPNPNADFMVEPIKDSLFFKLGTTLSFIDQSTDSWSYIDNWLWDFNDGNADSLQTVFHKFEDVGLYNVLLRVENRYGCTDTISKKVEISNFIIHIPNCFTPQKDNLNERFVSKGIGINEYLLNIYNRWGELIYSTNDMQYGWDGTYQSTGLQCPQGVYVYDVQVVDDFGDTHRFVGDVTLVD